MRKTVMAICMLTLVGALAVACAEPRFQRIETQPALGEVKAVDNGYQLIVAMVPVIQNQWGVPTSLQERYQKTVAETLARQSSGFKLLWEGAAGDPDVPDFRGLWPADNQATSTLLAIDRARRNGINALLGNWLAGFRTRTERKGMMFWRDERYELIVTLNMEILDPVTGATAANLMKEQTFKVDQAVYQAVEAGQWDGIGAIDSALEQMARLAAKAAVEGLKDLDWQTTVVSVIGDRVGLAVGRHQGLAPGHRLAVFAGQRLISSHQGQTYIEPGFKLGEIQISTVEGDHAEAVILSGGEINVGDIVVPVGH